MSDRTAYDILVLGAGSAGCVLASRLSADPDRSVCLVEAGPDYGPRAEGRWPADLLYANELATSHDWGFAGGWPYWRARVIGGCSAHNGCFVAWGTPADFDEWKEAGSPHWSSAAIEPYRRRAYDMLRVRPSRAEDLEPFMRAGLDAAAELGFPLLDDFDDAAAVEGASPIMVNAVGDVRWNAAFAYLDPARARPNLTIVPRALVDRIRLDGERATGAFLRVDGVEREITADVIVLAAGAYGSPSILLRSGVGAPDELERHSIDVQIPRPGVGRNLVDHPRVEVLYQPTPELLARTEAHLASRSARAQTLIKARSDACPPNTWDLHLMMRVRRPLNAAPDDASAVPVAHIYVHAMKPVSRGRVQLASRDPDDLPIVDHGFLSDAVGADRSTLASGIGLARRLAATSSMRHLIDGELAPGLASDGPDLDAYIADTVGGYWHPVGTCKMGHAGDPEAVVDASGRLHGSQNVYVADASIMPTIPRANTQLPVIAIAERIADLLRTR
jgi:choline dehydrogenase